MSPNDPPSISPAGVSPSGVPPPIDGQPPELTADPSPSAVGGVVDPGDHGDSYIENRKTPLSLPVSVGSSPPEWLFPFFDGQMISARYGNKEERCTVKRGARGQWILEDQRGHLFDGGAFLYDGHGSQLGVWVADRFLVPGEYEIIKDWLVDRRGRKVIANVLVISGRSPVLILTTAFPGTITLDGQNYAVDKSGKLTRVREPEYPSFSRFADNLSAYYNPATGMLILPVTYAGEKEARIDLNFPGLPPCQVERSTERNLNKYTFRWGEFFRIELRYNPITFASSYEAKISPVFGSYIKGGGIPATLEDIERMIGHFRKEVERKLAHSKNPAVAAYRTGLKLRSPLAQELIPLPHSERRLDDNYLGLVAENMGQQVDRVPLRYTDLGAYHENGEVTGPGIHTWRDLEAFIQETLKYADKAKSPVEKTVEIEIEERFFETLQPPPDFLARVTAITQSLPDRSLTLVVKGNPIDRPTVFRFDSDGVHVSLFEADKESIQFWEQAPLATALSNHFKAHPGDGLLLDALRRADRELPTGTLGELLEKAIELFNNDTAVKEGKIRGIPLNRQTKIYRMINQLTDNFRQVANEAIQRGAIQALNGADYWDPISTLLRRHPASTDPRHHAVIIGGGQMGTAWGAWIRNRIDTGETVVINGVETRLPLDTRMTVVEWSEALVDEMDRKGTNRTAFGNVLINPDDRIRLYYLPLPLLHEVEAVHPTKMEISALKADQLVQKTEDPIRRELLRRSKPAMPTPAKSFIPDDLIPFGALSKRWNQSGDGDLVDLEVVNGGYEKGKSILLYSLGLDQGDWELFMLFVAGSQEALDQTRFWFGDHHISYAIGRELAFLVQAAGALKNISTYSSGRVVMQRGLGKEQPKYADLQQILNAEIADNIELIEETIARIAPMYEIATYHLSLPYEVEMDVRKCLALKLSNLVSIRNRFEILIREGNIAALDQIISEIVDGNTELGGGTRNPRDGLIDELIFTAYHAFVLSDMLDDGDVLQSFVHELEREGKRQGYSKEEVNAFVEGFFFWAQQAKQFVIQPQMTFEDFYNAHYPEAWKGKKKQEGRNAIGPLMDYGDEHNVTLPPKIATASNLYRNGPSRETPVEYRQRSLTDADHPVWGIPQTQVEKLGDTVRRVRNALSKAHSKPAGPSDRFLAEGFERLVQVLDLSIIDQGVYTEVNRRLRAARRGAEILDELFRNNHIPPQRREQAIHAFEQTLNEAIELFQETRVDNTTMLITKLRHVIKQMYQVEKAICDELAQLGKAIDPRRERRNKAVRAIHANPPALSSMIGRSEPGTVAQGESTPPTVSDNGGPQNSVALTEKAVTGGAVYAGIPAVDGAHALALAPPQVFLTEPVKSPPPVLQVIEGSKNEGVVVDLDESDGIKESESPAQSPARFSHRPSLRMNLIGTRFKGPTTGARLARTFAKR